MLEKHSAAEAIGFDLEALVIDEANKIALEKNLLDRASFKCVKPGQLEIVDESIEVIFSKEAFIHIPDKIELIRDIHRVLKPGGRFFCLEFSKIQNPGLDFIYKNYSKLIPAIGKIVIGEKEPYEYLTKSIEQFLNQNELVNLIEKNGFEKCSYRNLSGGIVSLHSGWKI